MISMEIPIKPRRKHVEVPVHKPESHQEKHKIKKTYSANFSARKHKHRHPTTETKISEVIIEIPDKDLGSKISKKTLSKEIERMAKENENITFKFNELEELSVKKILKLKEKVNLLQNINDDILGQSEVIKSQYVELQKSYEEVYKQLEMSQVCKRCEELKGQIDTITHNNKILRKQNNEVNEDLGMLKTVVFRLNVQLERYQEKLTEHNISINKYSQLHPQKSSTSQLREDAIINILSSEHQNHRHTPISWGSVNSHTLGPLLDAYQDTISEKDEIIQTYELDLAKFTGQMKEIIGENESLYKKLTEDENCSIKLGKRLENLRTDLKLTRDQNDALIKKCAVKQDKIEDILRVYENKVDHMKRDYQVIHEEYIKLRTENASLKDKIKALIDSQDEFKNERHNYIPISVHTASVNECKKWYEELKIQYESEKLKMKETIDTQLQAIKDLNDTNKRIKQGLEERIVKLEKELKKSESKQLDLDHALKEVQLSRSAGRKQLHKAMCFAKDMVAEQETLLRALNQRQLENRAVKKIGSEMAVRMDSLKSQLKDVQKSAWQEFSTVEQRIHEQTELIETMKDDHNKEIVKLQDIIREQEEQLAGQKAMPMSNYQLFKDKYK